MRVLAALLVLAGPADAHPGHIAEVASHGHWIAVGAIGLAVLVGLWGKAAGRKDQADDADEPEEAEAEGAEA